MQKVEGRGTSHIYINILPEPYPVSLAGWRMPRTWAVTKHAFDIQMIFFQRDIEGRYVLKGGPGQSFDILFLLHRESMVDPVRKSWPFDLFLILV